MSLYKPPVKEKPSKKAAIAVSSSSALGLTNELALLKEKFARDKATNTKTKPASAKPVRASKAAWQVQSGANKGVGDRNARDMQQDVLDRKQKDNVRAALERKAKIYDRIKSGRDMDLNLADSALDVDLMSIHSSDRESDEDESEDELVEYTDDFGRTRMVPKSRLPELTGDQKPEPKNLIYGDVIQYNAFRGDENAMREILERDDTKDLYVHYDADKEVRTKGVGFYKFSKDEEARAKEMEELKNMREETKKMVSRTQEVRVRWLERRETRRKLVMKAKAELDAVAWLNSLGGNGLVEV